MFLEYMRSKIIKIFNYQISCLISVIGSVKVFPGYKATPPDNYPGQVSISYLYKGNYEENNMDILTGYA